MNITLDNLLARFNISKKVHFSSRSHYILVRNRYVVQAEIFRDDIIKKPNIL